MYDVYMGLRSDSAICKRKKAVQWSSILLSFSALMLGWTQLAGVDSVGYQPSFTSAACFAFFISVRRSGGNGSVMGNLGF